MSVAGATAPCWPLVADHQFILATREAGYRSLPAAIAELIDNAFQAGGRCVDVFVREEREGAGSPSVVQLGALTAMPATAQARPRRIEIAVLDDGTGMNANELRTALQFGGSARFDDRSGVGRFGMGLPNSSVSQSRRLEVFTWQGGQEPIFSFLDVDQIAGGAMREVPEPVPHALPAWVMAAGAASGLHTTSSGTLVVWPDCDRLPFRKASTVRAKLATALGRLYRYALRDGATIRIDGDGLAPTDPLMEWGPATKHVGAAASVGTDLIYELKVPASPTHTSTVRVRFSLLPIREWARLPIDVRRDLGVIGGAGVSIVRAGREIDYGWYFMGGKRKENYDDWWRCEVCFEPSLDEYFGVTHSKQGITPRPPLLDIMSSDMEQIARTLNVRVRGEFVRLAQHRPRANAVGDGDARGDERCAGVPPTPAMVGRCDAAAVAARCERKLPSIGCRLRTYRLALKPLETGRFFDVHREGDTAVLILNTNHPFYASAFARASEHPYSIRPGPGFTQASSGASRLADDAAHRLECVLLAAARAELGLVERRTTEPTELDRHRPPFTLDQYIEAWSDALAAFVSTRR